MYQIFTTYDGYTVFLQCFDAIVLMTGRVSGLYKNIAPAILKGKIFERSMNDPA